MSDMDNIEQLLNIADKARQWPNLKGLHDKAMAQLEGISTADTNAIKKLNEQLYKLSADNAELRTKLKEAEDKVEELEEKAHAAVVERESYKPTPDAAPIPHTDEPPSVRRDFDGA